MKILIDARPLQTYSRYRGIGRYVDTLVDLFKDNTDFHFLFFNGDDIDKRAKNRILISSPRRAITFTDRFLLPPLLRKNGIDIYHSTAYALPGTVEKIKFILTVYDITPLLFPRYSTLKNRIIFKKILKSGYRAHRITAISLCTKNDLKRVSGIPEEKIRVIYPAVNMKGAEISSDTPVPKGLPADFVLYAGGFDGNKNVRTIVKALNIFQKPLVLAGLVSEKAKTEFTGLLDPGMTDMIFFTGYVSDTELSALYQKARLFLFPSLYEGFGFPPLEALRMGTPSIVSPSGSLREVLKDSAVYVENPEDEKELAEKTATLWKDQEKRDELSDRGKIVLAQYSPRRFKEKMLAFYYSVFESQD